MPRGFHHDRGIPRRSHANRSQTRYHNRRNSSRPEQRRFAFRSRGKSAFRRRTKPTTNNYPNQRTYWRRKSTSRQREINQKEASNQLTIFVDRTRIGTDEFILSFEDERIRERVAESDWQILRQWFDLIKPWSPEYVPEARMAVVQIVGLRVIFWNKENISKLLHQWGLTVGFISNIDMPEDARACYVQISTTSKQRIEDSVMIKGGDIQSLIQISEVIDILDGNLEINISESEDTSNETSAGSTPVAVFGSKSDSQNQVAGIGTGVEREAGKTTSDGETMNANNNDSASDSSKGGGTEDDVFIDLPRPLAPSNIQSYKAVCMQNLGNSSIESLAVNQIVPPPNDGSYQFNIGKQDCLLVQWKKWTAKWGSHPFRKSETTFADFINSMAIPLRSSGSRNN